MILQAVAEQSTSWWSVLLSSGLGAAVLGLIVELLRQRSSGITKEKAATALRVAIDGFARELANSGRPTTAKELTRRIETKLDEAGEKAKEHNDRAVLGLGTIDAIARGLREVNR